MARTKLNPWEQRLVEDIAEFIQMFGREPTVEEVVDWAHDIYGCCVPENSAERWARRLIAAATMDMPKLLEAAGVEDTEENRNIAVLAALER